MQSRKGEDNIYHSTPSSSPSSSSLSPSALPARNSSSSSLGIFPSPSSPSPAAILSTRSASTSSLHSSNEVLNKNETDKKGKKKESKNDGKGARGAPASGVKKERTFKIIKKGMMNVENINKLKWYKEMVDFTTWLTESPMFRTVILTVLSINLVLIAVFSNPGLIPRYGAIFELVDLSFLIAYTFELFLKLLAGPKKFWKVNYNRFDLCILVLSYLQVANLGTYGVGGSLYFLRVFRALRALRVLRFISFVRDLQVLFTALLKTFKALAYVLTLLLLILFVGASIGFQLYATIDPENPANPYSKFIKAMLTLFCIVTADGWTNIQDELDEMLGLSSRVLIVIILFLGHFMYENLLAGLMIQYMTEADEEEKKFRKQRKLEAINKKKAFITEQQKQDLASFAEKQTQMMKDQPQLSFHEILTKLTGKISHSNIVPSSDLSCSLTWLELYTATLRHQEHNMYRIQQLHFELTKTLAEALERKLHTKIHV